MGEDEVGRIARWASDVKVIVSAIVAIIAAVAAAGIWFNGYVQAKATEGLAEQIGSSDSAIRTAFESMIDERAEEIEANLKAEIERSRDIETEHYEKLRSSVWKATNPARQADSGLPPEDE